MTSRFAIPVVALLVLVVSASADPAGTAGKPSPVSTIGPLPVVPADAPPPNLFRLTPVTVTSKRSSGTAGTGAEIVRHAPAPPSPAAGPEQQAKLAARSLSPTPRPVTGEKPAQLSTIVPLDPTRVPAADAHAARRGGDPTRVLGVIPRPEWSRPWSAKPAPVVTKSETPAPVAAPSTPEALQAGAAARSADPPAKPRETSTIVPADPAQVTPGPGKPSRSRRAGKEVRP